jgi:hypothetical protein
VRDNSFVERRRHRRRACVFERADDALKSGAGGFECLMVIGILIGSFLNDQPCEMKCV